jgi:nucleoside-diphosphate-sugar epimerase
LQVSGDGNQTKPYVYIDDCIGEMLFSSQNAKDKIDVFNLAVPTVISVRYRENNAGNTGHKETNVRYT